MNGTSAIQTALKATQSMMNMFLSDFTDADLFVRPVPTANHAAWQIGNVIAGDAILVKEQLPDAAYPELPAGFAETHGPEGTKQDGPDGFLTKAEYLSLFDAVLRGDHRRRRRALRRRSRPAGHRRYGGVRPDTRAHVPDALRPHLDARRPVHGHPSLAG